MRTILILLALASAAFAGASSLEPFHGTWMVDYERSWDLAIQYPGLEEGDSLSVRQYLDTMSEIMQMSIGDEYLTYRRGRHEAQVPYEVVAASEDSVTVDIETRGSSYQLTFSWFEEGYLYIASTATPNEDYFVYRRVSEQSEDYIPFLPGSPGKK